MSNNGFRKFSILWAGEFISAIGSGLTSFGLGIYVYQLTGKTTAMSLVTLLAFFPSVILGAPAGVLADRHDRRLLMLIGDSFSAIGLVLILVSMILGKANLPIICIGVTISSIFSALMEPAYKATVSDLLSEDEYTRASGMIQIASSSKYLIAPIIAGFLLTIADIKLLLIIDICTFFVTVFTITFVRKGLKAKIEEHSESIVSELLDGIRYVKKKNGILILIISTSLITFFMGFIQTLSIPMVLAFTNEATLGSLETAIASGMLVSSILLGIWKVKSHYHRMLFLGLTFNGFFMFLFGMKANIIYVGITGFFFFATLPFVNTGIDCLIRRNLDNNMQGRVWGLIGMIAPSGYIFSYAFCGLLADYVFTPLLRKDGALAGSVGKIYGTGEGRGIGLLISIAGLVIMLLSLVLAKSKKVKALDVEEVILD